MIFQSCQRYCLQKDIYVTCACFHPNLVVSKLNPFTDKPPCLITPELKSMHVSLYKLQNYKGYAFHFPPLYLDPDYVCIKNVTNQYESGKKKCPCNVACK